MVAVTSLSRGRHLGVLQLLLLVLGTQGCKCGQASELPPPPPAVVASPAPVTPDAGNVAVDPGAVVLRSVGKTEVRRSGDDAWDVIQVGDRLEEQDSVRTSHEGSVELVIGEVKIQVLERSELKLKKVSAQGVRARVLGAIDSKVPEGGGESLEIEAEGSEALVVSNGGHFSMTSDGRGVVAVASVRGQVRLSARGSSVDVGPGQISRVKQQGLPEAPSAALRKVLVSVTWPERHETNKRILPLQGRVEVGSRVFIHGQPVPVDAQGHFMARVPLAQGRQAIHVQVTDVLGREVRESESYVLDMKRPDINLDKRPWAR